MFKLNGTDLKIIRLLQNYPLDSFSSLSKKLGISPQSFIRRVERLKKRGILRGAIASFIPEVIGLHRYNVLFHASQISQMTMLSVALHAHPYTRGYNRFYGEHFGLYATFDLPPSSERQFTEFLEYLTVEKFCDSYESFASTGYRLGYPVPFPNYQLNPKNFNVFSYWSERFTKSNKLEALPEPIDLSSLTPIHLLILREITLDARKTQSQLINYFKSLVTDPELTKKLDLPEAVVTYLSDFFEGRSEYAIKMEISRQYNFVKSNIITGPRWNFNRKFTDFYVSRAYLISEIPDNEKNKLYNLFKDDRPPFRLGLDLLKEGIFINFSLPAYYDAIFSYLVWSSFSGYRVYSLDFFGKHGIYFHFYINNFDFDKKIWKTNRNWLLDKVLENIKSKLKNGNYIAKNGVNNI